MEANRRDFFKKMGLSSFLVCTGMASVNAYPRVKGVSGSTLTISNGNLLLDGIYNVFSFGAKGDGKTLDTHAIQVAIDRCAEEGGGTVYLHKGCFISGTLYLKSNVTLHIDAGAILRASNNLEDFPITPSKYFSKYPYKPDGSRVTHNVLDSAENYKDKGLVTHKALIYAEDQQNITINGRGVIDGNWYHWKDEPWQNISFWEKPHIIQFRGCENIHVRDVTLYNAGTWVQFYRSCSNLVIDGITVDSRENPDIEKPRYADYRGTNMDGLGMADCEKVRISNCYINSGDDGIVLKSFSPDEVCQDIVITNCVISTNANGIKIGTETSGGFRDITVQNCVVYDTRGDALSIMTVDGARIERINFSNISIRNMKGTAIFIRLGTRNRLNRYDAAINEPYLKDIVIENIQGADIESQYCCSVAGTPDYKVENIVLRNINLNFVGGGNLEDSFITVPERDKGYPNGRMYGKLPAYGFFIRHAKNITLENIQIDFARKDLRPALICDNVEQLDIKRFKASATLDTPELIRLINTRDVVISGCRPATPVPVFLNLQGNESGDIYLLNNILKDAKQVVILEKEIMKTLVTQSGTIR